MLICKRRDSLNRTTNDAIKEVVLRFLPFFRVRTAIFVDFEVIRIDAGTELNSPFRDWVLTVSVSV
jgi:hypothetical protein